MQKEEPTPSQRSPMIPRIADRKRRYWDKTESRVIGGVLILLAFATYVQTQNNSEQDKIRGEQVAALSSALTSEQDNTKNLGQTPVAPAPDKIVNDPQIVQIPGQKGDKGDTGASGAPGKPGKDGKDGTSATLPPLDTLKGAQGDQGLQGIQGEPGKDGTDGTDGQDGKDGTNGVSPTDITFTINNYDGTSTTYVCTPVAVGSSSFSCDTQAANTPSPNGTN